MRGERERDKEDKNQIISAVLLGLWRRRKLPDFRAPMLTITVREVDTARELLCHHFGLVLWNAKKYQK